MVEGAAGMTEEAGMAAGACSLSPRERAGVRGQYFP